MVRMRSNIVPVKKIVRRLAQEPAVGESSMTERLRYYFLAAVQNEIPTFMGWRNGTGSIIG
jgi:hypothetical protein